MREGWVQPDVLQWLKDGLSDADWSWDVREDQKDRWTEFGQKLEICGHLSGAPGRRRSLDLNGKDARPLPVVIRAFALAFKEVYRVSLETLGVELKAAVRKLKKSDRGQNGAQFLASSALDWAFDLGALQLMRANDRLDPVHFDGGASFLHVGLTLFGERALRVRHLVGTDRSEATADTPRAELEMPMSPGHVYFGCLCGPEHYVVHKSSEKLSPSEALGPVEVVVLLRSRCFRAARGSTQQSGPVPLALWHAAADSVVGSVGRLPWLLPTLPDCKKQQGKLVG